MLQQMGILVSLDSSCTLSMRVLILHSGNTAEYCGTGCQKEWGSCSLSPSPSKPATKDSTCGVKGAGYDGYTCLGSQDGDCCSQYGWCGSSSDYCGQGCQPDFGTCTGVKSSSSKAVK